MDVTKCHALSVSYRLSGILYQSNNPIYGISEFPNVAPRQSGSTLDLRGLPESKPMKPDPPSPNATPATLQTVLDRLADNAELSHSRRRDLRSAILSFCKLMQQPPGAIPLDLAAIRSLLDAIVPAQAKVSRKRWANRRSDLAAAIAASGLRPMLKTADVARDEVWKKLLAPADQRIRHGLSRFARWATLRRIAPQSVDDDTIDRFIAELDATTLVRNLPGVRRAAVMAWNALVRLHEGAGLRPVAVPPSRFLAKRVPWQQLPVPFRADVDKYLTWASVPDALDEGARARALAPLSLRLQRGHIHSAVSAAAAAGIPLDEVTSLASLVELEVVRAILRHRWREDGEKLTAYTHGVAVTLIAIASEWVKAPADMIAKLKALRSKLGTLPSGLTEKNTALLRKFDDPRLLEALLHLPDKLWRAARRGLATSRWPFIDLQSALAIDLLLHAPMRMQNLASLTFGTHLHWPQGRGKPALVTIRGDESKNDAPLEFEIPTVLAERLQVYRNEIAPAVTGKRPDAAFVTFSGKPRTQATITVAIERTLLRHLGVKMTCHQFRHLAAKLILDENPGAFELVRQLLGHKNPKTTVNFYAGLNTRRAGRAHAGLIMKLRESRLSRTRHRRTSPPRED
jgi:integrase